MPFSSTRPTKGRWYMTWKAPCHFPRISGNTRRRLSGPTKQCGLNITENSVWCPPACIYNSSRQADITWSARTARGSRRHRIILRSRRQVCRRARKFRDFRKIFRAKRERHLLKIISLKCNLETFVTLLSDICSIDHYLARAMISRRAYTCAYNYSFLIHRLHFERFSLQG